MVDPTLWERLKQPENFFIVLLSALVALLAIGSSNLGFVNVINGASSSGAFCGFAPSVIGLYLLSDPKYQTKTWRAIMYTLFIFSISCLIIGLLLTDNYVDLLTDKCMLWSE